MNIDTEYKAIIKLPYQPGVLKAVSCDANGKELSASILRTSGVPAGFRLTADRNQIKADGQDFVASGFESAWRMEPFCQEKNIPFWCIRKEGDHTEI